MAFTTGPGWRKANQQLNQSDSKAEQLMSQLKPWINIPADSDFSIYNLPFGIFSVPSRSILPRAAAAVGDQLIDLSGAAGLGLFNDLVSDPEVFTKPTLNDFIALGKSTTNAVRARLQKALCDPDSILREHPQVFPDRSEVVMHMPVKVGDYTDFYSSIEHATNVGRMFRDPENALLPNWRHLPVGYHGRASSIVVSGTPIPRPKGQVMPAGAEAPVYQSSGRLDFELEMAFIIGKNSQLGKPVPIAEAESYIFGLVLFNDWSARDIQKWEYVPLGPFLGKSFASSVSPWVVPLEALDPFRVAGPVQEPAVLPYLQSAGPKNYDIDLEVSITPAKGPETTICRSNFRYMYWNMCQQLAHHTVNGCNLRVGDMMASGTISGKDAQSYGSMLELTWAGSKPFQMPDGTERKFLRDLDTVTMRGYAEKDGKRVGFGSVTGQIVP